MLGLCNLLLAASLALGASAAKSAGCGKAPTIKDTTSLEVTINGKPRQYFVKIPPKYDSSRTYRLIFTLHALGGNAAQVPAGQGGYLPWYGLPALDTNNTSIYVSPNGISNGWANSGGDDITFIKELIKIVETDLCVDTDYRFSTGFSYGAAMSYSIACSFGKEFRAVAALSGGTMSGCVGQSDPVAYYAEHGISDQVLPIAGARAMRDKYVKLNGCTPQTPEEPAKGSGKHIKTVYQGCKPGFPVTWIAFDGPHTPQPKDTGVDKTFAADETWAFFQQFQLP